MDYVFAMLVFTAVMLVVTYRFAAGRERRRYIRSLLSAEAVDLQTKPTARRGYLAGLEALARQAGFALSQAEMLGSAVMLAAVLFGVGLALFGEPLVAFLLSGLAFYLPGRFLEALTRRRAARMLSQLAKFLPAVANYLRAGYSLQQAVVSGTAKTPPPFQDVFVDVKKDMDAGIPVTKALEKAASRVPLTEFQLLVMATKINNQIGGNLADVYDTIAETISERLEITEQQKAYTTQAKLNSTIVGLMAVSMLVIFKFISPGYFSPLLQSWSGQLVFAGCWISMLIGWLTVRRLAVPRF